LGVTGVLPWFWVYAHVGKILGTMAGDLPDTHPYKTWIDTYGGADFDAATRQAVSTLETQLARATRAEYEHMSSAFTRSCVYELHFWASAHAAQDWDTSPFTRQERAIMGP